MPIGEFSLIKQYFSTCTPIRTDVALGIGDDGAVVSLPPGNQLVVSTDTLVSGVHFLPDMPARAIAYKALAANLSDLAAMGATPRWITLALTMPTADEHWISAFSGGLKQLCEYFGVQLIGGDTTRGPLSITVTVMGSVPEGKALHRGGAWPGDWIFVTGTLGDSAAGLALLQQMSNQGGDDAELIKVQSPHNEFLIERHYHPSPRIVAGQSLRDVATAAIDVSDGLMSDLAHILKMSGCNAHIDLENLPLSDALKACCSEQQAVEFALSGGEDYELLFTVSEENRGMLTTALSQSGTAFACIGRLVSGEGAIELKRDGLPVELDANLKGWQHF